MTKLDEDFYRDALSRGGVVITETKDGKTSISRGERGYGTYPTSLTYEIMWAIVTTVDSAYEAGESDGRRRAFSDLRELIGAAEE